MSKLFASVFSMEEFNSLDSLGSVLAREYNDLLYHVKKDEEKVNGLPDSEKYFVFSWKNKKEVQEITLPLTSKEQSTISPDDDEENSQVTCIRFQSITANIEYSKRKRKDDDDNFLPKADRLNTIEIEVVFFEKNSKVFVLILSSNLYHINRVKQLIGTDKIQENSSEYSLESDVFNWLIYVYDEKIGELSDSLKLDNVNGFVGNVTDDANVFSGSSQQTTELIVTKAFISNGGELKKIGIRISNDEASVTCMVNERSVVAIDCRESKKLRILDSLDTSLFLLLYFYGYLIVEIKSLYEADSESFNDHERFKFSKKIGIEVINSIIEKNKIEVTDIILFNQENGKEIILEDRISI